MADTFAEQAPEPETVTSEPEEVTSDDDEVEAVISASLSHEAMRARWQARRPGIAHLKEGLVEALGEPDERGFRRSEMLPLFDVGTRIVVDCRTPMLNDTPWLRTIVGKVRSIDDDTGIVSIFDEDSDFRNPKISWVGFKAPHAEHHIFKLAPEKGDPFAVSAVRAAAKPEPKPGEEKRGRGRPKGSLNRSKEEIAAERDAYRKMREEKKARRGR